MEQTNEQEIKEEVKEQPGTIVITSVMCAKCKKQMEPEKKNGRDLKTCAKCREERRAKYSKPKLERQTGLYKEQEPPSKFEPPEYTEDDLEETPGELVEQLEEVEEEEEDQEAYEESLANFIMISALVNGSNNVGDNFKDGTEIETKFKEWISKNFNLEILKKK